jgi:hypothetical protein
MLIGGGSGGSGGGSSVDGDNCSCDVRLVGLVLVQISSLIVFLFPSMERIPSFVSSDRDSGSPSIVEVVVEEYSCTTKCRSQDDKLTVTGGGASMGY